MSLVSSIASGHMLIDSAFVLGEAGVTEGMTVADLGCGSHGFFVFQASKMVGDKGVVYAVDIQKPVLEAIDSKLRLDNVGNVRTVRTDLEVVGAARTSIPDGSLDVDFLINTLYQTKDYTAVCREAARMLKNGGRLLIIEWKKTAAPMGPEVSRRLDQAIARQCAEAAGLILEKNFVAGQYHYGMVFVKK